MVNIRRRNRNEDAHTHTPQRVYYARVLDHEIFISFDAMSELSTVTRAECETLTYIRASHLYSIKTTMMTMKDVDYEG